MPDIPREKSFDSTRALLREGYCFVSRRCARLASDAFQTRLMLKKVVCVRGAEASRMFYEHGRFTRRGALPSTTVALLQDKGSVMTLDGAAHSGRKALFMDIAGEEPAALLAQHFEREWRAALPRWQAMKRIVLLDELNLVITRAVCDWAGVPLADGEAEERAREISAMVENSARFGPSHWRARLLRRRAERWARRVVDDIRAGTLTERADAPAAAIARFREDGKQLPVDVAAVELINILRPTVAVSRFITFAALALHRHPELADRLSTGSEDELPAFVQEVRRTTPFLPMIGGRVLAPFEWRGHRFVKGDWVLLDLHGTDIDDRLWPEPKRFRPDRFKHMDPDPHALIPQGGGDARTGHRCPGEAVAIALMMSAVRLLTREMRYTVPEQDLSVDLARIPATPATRFVISDVRSTG
jgi:fatty-acid peroxygenase